MKWSWKLGKVADIDLFVHVTFLILLGWVAVLHWMQGEGLIAVMNGLLFIVTLFGIVVLHELGHALTARHFGIRTRDITLLPIGGVARLEKMPDDPKQELLVALAGPAVNVVIAIVLFLLLIPVKGLVALSDVAVIGEDGNFLIKLLWINVILAGFNLLPAFPMDGGRVLRALLAMKIDYVRATQIAANIGQGMAVLFGAIGLFINPFLVFIALFVWMGATGEAYMVQMKHALSGISVDRVMITDFRTLQPSDFLSQAATYILSGFQHDFPVVKDGKLVGMLTRNALLKALTQHGGETRVGEAAERHESVKQWNEILKPPIRPR